MSFYDATAEAEGITLVNEIEGQPVTLGDKNLLTDAAPGLIARIVLPRANAVVSHRENLPEPLPVGTIG